MSDHGVHHRRGGDTTSGGVGGGVSASRSRSRSRSSNNANAAADPSFSFTRLDTGSTVARGSDANADANDCAGYRYVPPNLSESAATTCVDSASWTDGALASPPNSNRQQEFLNNTNTCKDIHHESRNATTTTTTRSNLGRFLRESAWPGMGLFGESYLLFSVGTLRPVWELLYPECFAGSSYAGGNDGDGDGNANANANNDDRYGAYREAICSDATLRSITLSVVVGVIIGMITLGTLSNRMGRRAGSILTASLMAAGSLGMTLISLVLNDDGKPARLFCCMSAFLFVFGIGVGGEYPISAASANERAMMEMRKRMREEDMNNTGTGTGGRDRGRGWGRGRGGGIELTSKPRKNIDREGARPQFGSLGSIAEGSEQRSAASTSSTGAADESSKTVNIENVSPTGKQEKAWVTNGYNNIDIGGGGSDGHGASRGEGNATDKDEISFKAAARIYKANESERSSARQQKQKYSRGRGVLLVFTMQGCGVFFNALTLTFLLLVTNQVGTKPNDSSKNMDDDFDGMDDNYVDIDDGDDSEGLISGSYNALTLMGIWQITYVIGAAILIYVLISRIIFLKESEVWAADKEMRQHGGAVAGAGHNHREDESPQKSYSLQQRAEAPGVGSCEKGGEESGGHRGPFGRQEKLTDNDELDVDIANTMSSLSNPSNIGNSFDYGGSFRQVPSTTSADDRQSTAHYLLLRNYGYRLAGTSLSWLLWDVAFYGNKLFQSSFLVALTGEDITLFELTGVAALNALVALFGYFAAAFIVDYPWVGRFRLQSWGFFVTGALFVSCGFLKGTLSTGWLVVVYFMSSFFGQCGPNATTFLVPAEIFPTECRTMCHGISAASGKLGALIAAFLFNYVDDVLLFLISGYCSFAACIITFLTIPETTTLDLYEVDRKWRMILAGRKGDYVGLANSPEYISYIERRKLGLEY